MGCPPHNNVFQAETLVGISFQTPAGAAGAGNSPSVSELLFIHIFGPCESYDFKVLVKPVKANLHGNVARFSMRFDIT
ncbi:MAG: hypothetical protein IKQ52_11250, partial [Bacteroidales bacterium]|nr:hypothetical protein [Bacteroidales bacterium]